MRVLTAEQTGIDFVNQLSESNQLNIIEYLYYYNGGGVAIGDVNNDGLEDLFFTANQGPDKLYMNRGNMQFEDVSEQANIKAEGTWSSGVVMEDINNDGYLDIHICKVGVLTEAHNLVYINQGDGTFREMAAELGLAFQGFATQVAFLDYDRDGDLDMYLLNHNIHSVRSYGAITKRQERDPYAGDRLYENRLNAAEKSFVDVTTQAGIYNSPLGYGLAITCADINGDGWTDIYIGNDFHENDYIYINNGDKTFTESVGKWTDHTTQFSMGVDVADIDNDLLPDIFSTDMLPFDEEIYMKSGGEDTDQIKRIKADLGFEDQYARNHLQINTGQGAFLDMALQTRTFATDWSWAVLLQDFDNNGRKDIFVTNGIAKRPNDLDYINYLNSEAIAKYAENDPERTRQLIEKLPAQKLHNVLFWQTDALVFSTVAESQVGTPTFSNGAAYGDLDNDGYLELVTNNINEPASVLAYNRDLAGGNHILLTLSDPTKKTTKGTKVYVHTGGQVRYQELQTVKGYQSSSSHRLHFGLGAASRVDSVVIVWPDWTRQVVTGLAINAAHTVAKADTGVKWQPLATAQPRTFNVLPVRHDENTYNDDEAEKLIPERLSREGPGVLYEDLDGDGIADLVLGGAHNYPMQVLKGKRDGSFENLQIPDLAKDARYEDVSIASIDFDGDGDRDLYVVSGGSAGKELDKVLEDRLYLNNGGMDFRRIPLSLPHTNGSVVAVADFDGDGYEDMFVGARSIPGAYGLAPYSFLLKNNGGMGLEIALKERLGMVTDARWTDIDADGHPDLVVCGDWMPVMVLKNDGKGAMATWTEFPVLTGLWKTLAFADINGDGRVDVLAGNLGTNALMQASPERPVRMYVGDFDDSGTLDQLIFFHYFKRYVPLGSKDKHTVQMPSLKKQFVTYADFAKLDAFEAMLPDSARTRLVESPVVDELRSMVFLSGSDGYQAVPLPARMQAVTIQDMVWDATRQMLTYVGSSAELVAVHGNASAAKLGQAAAFDKAARTFGQDRWLPSPVGVQARKIIPLGNGKALLVTNNDYLYIVDL